MAVAPGRALQPMREPPRRLERAGVDLRADVGGELRQHASELPADGREARSIPDCIRRPDDLHGAPRAVTQARAIPSWRDGFPLGRGCVRPGAASAKPRSWRLA